LSKQVGGKKNATSEVRKKKGRKSDMGNEFGLKEVCHSMRGESSFLAEAWDKKKRSFFSGRMPKKRGVICSDISSGHTRTETEEQARKIVIEKWPSYFLQSRQMRMKPRPKEQCDKKSGDVRNRRRCLLPRKRKGKGGGGEGEIGTSEGRPRASHKEKLFIWTRGKKNSRKVCGTI